MAAGCDIGENGQTVITKPAFVSVVESSRRIQKVCNKKCKKGKSHNCKDEPVVDIKIRVHEGKKHQVRRMVRAKRLRMIHLHRSNIGSLALDGVEQGTWRTLTEAEVDCLYEEAGGRTCPQQWKRDNFKEKLLSPDYTAEEKEKMQKYLDETKDEHSAKVGYKMQKYLDEPKQENFEKEGEKIQKNLDQTKSEHSEKEGVNLEADI